MLFFVYLKDFPERVELRGSVRVAHQKYMAHHEKHIVLGGPTSENHDSDPNGTVLLLDLPDHESAIRFLDDDPYYKAGLFSDRTISVWHPVRVSLDALSNLAR
jgi:uncharacterized protein YciI